MRQRGCSLFLLFAACLLVPRTGLPQGLTGTLIGTVRDEQGGALPGAQVTLSSPALIGGPANSVTNEKGQLRFQALPPGLYALEMLPIVLAALGLESKKHFAKENHDEKHDVRLAHSVVSGLLRGRGEC